MELAADFAFQPLDNDEGTAAPAAAPAAAGLGPLAGLAGNWSGQGFNAIWRPHTGASDHFLELNVTSDGIDLEVINGNIPNRGLVQGQIFFQGLTYLQQISDANVKVDGAPAGLHIEPGLWINVPPTTDPHEPATVARLASIPHGTTILLQGTATTAAGGPSIPDVSLTPFTIGHPNQTVDFAEQHLNQTTQFRTSGVGLTGITQAMLNNANSVLTRNPPECHHDDQAARVVRRGHHRGRRHVEHGFPGRHQGRPERPRRARRGDVLAADAARRYRAQAAAVLPDRPAELRRPELAAHHGGHADQGMRPAPGAPSGSPHGRGVGPRPAAGEQADQDGEQDDAAEQR